MVEIEKLTSSFPSLEVHISHISQQLPAIIVETSKGNHYFTFMDSGGNEYLSSMYTSKM